MVGRSPSLLSPRGAARRRGRREIRSWFARSLLPIPCAYLAGAVGLGLLAPAIDRAIGTRLTAGGSASSDARDVLTSTATGMIAFTGLVVASVLVLVQFAASQYSPRLVLWFRRDRLVKHAIGSFLAAPLFALVALLGLERERVAFRPDVTVATTLVLLIGAAVLFLALLQRVIDRLRPRSLFATVARAGVRAVRAIYPVTLGVASSETTAPEHGSIRDVPFAGHAGVITAFDRPLLVALAQQAGLSIEIVPGVGEFLSRGQTLLRVVGAGALDDGVALNAITIDEERTIEQDPAFAIRIIVDTAIRALSPAVNDPTTAVQALDALEVIVRELAGRDLEASHAHDSSGVVRLAWHSASWEELTGLAFNEIRAYGASSLQVVRRLRAVLQDLLGSTPDVRHAALKRHLERLDVSLELALPARSPDLELARTPDRMGLGLGPSR
jgi:uncharacterized membrane protein